MPAHHSSLIGSSSSYRSQDTDFNDHHFLTVRQGSAPYPSAEDVFHRTDSPNHEDSLEDLGNVVVADSFGLVIDNYILGLHDMINVGKHIAHKTLDRLELTNYQSGLLSRGVQPYMDRREPYDRVQ